MKNNLHHVTFEGGPPSLLIQRVAGDISPGMKQPGREAVIHLHLVPRLRMLGAIPPFSLRLHDVVLN